MKKFILHTLLGLLVFCALWIVAECTFAKVQVRNDYSYKYNYAKGNPAVKTLFIGHSHFECGINTHILDSAFNGSISGRRWPYWDVEYVKQMLPTMPNIKTVVYPLGYVMPYESPHYTDYHEEGVKDYMYWYSKYMHIPYDRFPYNYIYGSALLRNKMGTKYWRDEAVDSLGYYARIGMSSVWDEESKFDPYFYTEDTATMCYQEFQTYLIELAQVCADNGARLVVVTTPCANCFVANTREQGVCNMYRLVDSVKELYPIEYFNYLNDEEFRNDSIYFNSTHLNAIGADKFTKRICLDLKL